jgi:hypothetical protein
MGQMTNGKMPQEANVYRVRTSENRWYVFQEPEAVPVACFDDKAAALNYAMCLARGRVAWHLLLRQHGVASESAPRATGQIHH